ncbi:Zinc finger, RING/FYVE/PHD-type, partial [Cinara cedri]
MNCSNCNCDLATADCIQCSKCSKLFHIACSSIVCLTGSILKSRCSSWLYTICEGARLGVRKSPARARNLIIFNAPEPDGNNENDISLIKSVFHVLTPNIAPAIVSRLGQKTSKPRPLKVTLHEPSDIFIILKNKHKLRTSPIYGSIRISPDRTIMQRNQLRDIMGKIEERKAAGESNLVMKFVK